MVAALVGKHAPLMSMGLVRRLARDRPAVRLTPSLISERRSTMPSSHPALARADSFCKSYNIRVPILQAPMAGACPASLAIAVANAGGLGGCGALLMEPAAIKAWAAEMRAGSNGGFQFNLWIPDPPPRRDAAHEAAMRAFLKSWGPEVARRGRRRDATRFRRAVRRAARSRAGDRLVDHGRLSARFCRADEVARHQMVRHRQHRDRGAGSGGGGRRRHRRARHGSGRPSRRLRRRQRRERNRSDCSRCCRRWPTRCACR